MPQVRMYNVEVVLRTRLLAETPASALQAGCTKLGVDIEKVVDARITQPLVIDESSPIRKGV